MNVKTVNQRYETITWGALFLLIGCLSIIPGNQSAAAVFGIGIVLLGLNLARRLSRIPLNAFSTTLGALALILGALFLLRPLLGWEFQLQLPLIPVLLIVAGLYLLLPGPKELES